MELNEMIKSLIDSGVVENQELGVTMLTSDEVSDEEKRRHIDKFIEDYTSGKVNFFDDQHKYLFESWVKIYLSLVEGEVKHRVKRLE